MRAVYLSDPDAYIRCHDLPGREPARVYLHGVARASAPAFAHVAACPPLNERRSLLVDFLGFGYSDRPKNFGYTMEDHAATVIALLDRLGLQGCEVIGHSMGGSVAILIAAARPDLVSRLALAEANLDPGPGSMTGPIIAQTEEDYLNHGYAQDLAAQQERARTSQAALPGVVLGMYQVSAPWAIHRSSRSLVRERKPTFRDQLLALRLPRAFLVGSKTLEAGGRPASGEDGEGLDEAGIRRFVVPGAGHPMMYQNPGGFTRAIAEAIRWQAF